MEITHILQHLFNKASLEEVPVSALQQITDQYPYFATGHFLLSKKLKLDGSENFRAGLQKTNLYFHDTLWLHHLLKEDRGHSGEPESAINIKNLAAEVSVAAVTGGASSVAVDSQQNEISPASEHEPAYPASLTSDNPSELPEPDTAQAPPQQDSGEETEPFNSIIAPGTSQPDSFIEAGQDTGAETIQDTLGDTNTETQLDVASNSGQQDNLTEPQQKTNTETHTISNQPDSNDNSAENHLVRPETENNALGHPVTEPEINQTGSRPIENKLVEGSPLITFDPYHTIDYFASLGIRLSNEIKPDDKLGNQLKSFTQWLKTMKKLPSGVVENSGRLEPFENARIEKIAAHSLEEKETITEAMAEVLIKQGKTEKAKAVYQKLSLLNPGKFAYFAAKIDELKQY